MSLQRKLGFSAVLAVVMGDMIQWDLGDLGPGASMDLAFSVVLDTDMLCCNQAFLQSDERDACGLTAAIPTDDPSTMAADDPTCASPGPQPLLDIQKTYCVDPEPMTGCPGDVMLGNQVLWTVTITNNGAGPATAAQFNDDFNLAPCLQNFAGPAGVTFMRNQRRSVGEWHGYSSWKLGTAPEMTLRIPRAAWTALSASAPTARSQTWR